MRRGREHMSVNSPGRMRFRRRRVERVAPPVMLATELTKLRCLYPPPFPGGTHATGSLRTPNTHAYVVFDVCSRMAGNEKPGGEAGLFRQVDATERGTEGSIDTMSSLRGPGRCCPTQLCASKRQPVNCPTALSQLLVSRDKRERRSTTSACSQGPNRPGNRVDGNGPCARHRRIRRRCVCACRHAMRIIA